MTIERYDRQITYSCDSGGCSTTLETETDDFHEALAMAKDAGWKIRKVVGEWMHFCPDADCQP